MNRPIPCDLHLVNFRTIFSSEPTVTEAALILHRRGFDCTFGTLSNECSLTNGQVHCCDTSVIMAKKCVCVWGGRYRPAEDQSDEFCLCQLIWFLCLTGQNW